MHHGELLNKSIKAVTRTKVPAAGTGVDVSRTIIDASGTVVDVLGTVHQYLAKNQYKTDINLHKWSQNLLFRTPLPMFFFSVEQI